MKHRKMVLVLFLSSLVFSVYLLRSPVGSLAEMYKYVDESGATVIVSSPSEVPQKYREKAEHLRSSTPTSSSSENAPKDKPSAVAPWEKSSSGALSKTERLLVGRWLLVGEASETVNSAETTFGEDRSFEAKVHTIQGSELVSMTTSGTWEIQGEELRLTLMFGHPVQIEPGTSKMTRIVELTRDKLVLERPGSDENIQYKKQ